MRLSIMLTIAAVLAGAAPAPASAQQRVSPGANRPERPFSAVRDPLNRASCHAEMKKSPAVKRG